MARNTIGSMTAVVRATAGQFKGDIDDIRGDVNRLKGAVSAPAPQGGMMSMFAAGGAIGAGIAAAQGLISGLTGTVRKFFDTISEMENLGDFASQIGATAEEVSGLRFAAEQMGSSSEAMDKALEKMVVRIGEARGGAKETRDAFESLGVDVDQLANMSAGDALKVLADGFKNVANPADQAALATDIFGRSSLDLVNVLNQGSAGIDQMIDRGKELGAVLGDEDVAAASEASLAIKEMKAAWQGLWNQLTIAVVPALKFVVEALTEVFAWINKTIEAIREALEWLGLLERTTAKIEAPKVSGSSVLADLKAQQKAAADLAKQQADQEKSAERALDAMMRRGQPMADRLRTHSEIFEDTLADLRKLLDVNAIDLKTYQRAIEQAKDTLDKSRVTSEKFEPTQGVAALESGTTAAFSAIQAATRGQMDERRKAEQQREELIVKQQEQIQEMKLLREAMVRGRGSIQAANI